MILICIAIVQLTVTVTLFEIARNNLLKVYYSVAKTEKVGIIIKRADLMHMVHDQNSKEPRKWMFLPVELVVGWL